LFAKVLIKLIAALAIFGWAANLDAAYKTFGTHPDSMIYYKAASFYPNFSKVFNTDSTT